MKNVFIISLLAVSALIAGEVKYVCPPNGFISATIDGVSQKVDLHDIGNSEHYTLKTNWYGQPIYFQEERKKVL